MFKSDHVFLKLFNQKISILISIMQKQVHWLLMFSYKICREKTQEEVMPLYEMRKFVAPGIYFRRWFRRHAVLRQEPN